MFVVVTGCTYVSTFQWATRIPCNHGNPDISTRLPRHTPFREKRKRKEKSSCGSLRVSFARRCDRGVRSRIRICTTPHWTIPHRITPTRTTPQQDDYPTRATPYQDNSALIWQKEASDKSDISCKRAKCVCHLHWRQWNIMMSYLTYLLVGLVFCMKFGLEEELIMWIMKTSITQVWMVCHLLPFAKVGQNSPLGRDTTRTGEELSWWGVVLVESCPSVEQSWRGVVLVGSYPI